MPRLGPANLALVSLYFVPVWGTEAVRALISPFGGFEDRTRAVAATFLRRLFDPGFDALVCTLHVISAVKLVIAAGFVAYLIEFARAFVIGREPDRQTIDTVLLLAVAAVVIGAVPAVAVDDVALVRLHATQLLLVAGAMVLITVERHIEQAAAPALTPPAPTDRSPQEAALPAAAAMSRPEGYKARLNAWRARRGNDALPAR